MEFTVNRMKIGRFRGLYYLVVNFENKRFDDEIDIADLIEVEYSSFIVDMIVGYKGEEMSGNLLFKDREGALKAIDEYLIPKCMMKVLVNS